MKKYYLAYGSNLNLEEMKSRCPLSKPVGAAVIPNYRLVYKGVPYRSFLTIEPCEGETVPVGIYEITEKDEARLDIYEGEFCAIVGTSGSGKSTMLNMLAGLEKPTKGQVVIGGEHIETMNENQLVKFRRDHVGFIFQSFNLLQTMTAQENVALPLVFRGEEKKDRLKKAGDLLDLVGLPDHKKHKPNEMSGGQQQRVGVARALVVDPEIIFADEPTGNLDSNTSRDIMNMMQKVVREQKKTLVMVTHDNHLASFADRIFHIIDGKIVKIEDNRQGENKL